MLARVASTCSVTEMEELKKETKNSTTKANLFEEPEDGKRKGKLWKSEKMSPYANEIYRQK